MNPRDADPLTVVEVTPIGEDWTRIGWRFEDNVTPLAPLRRRRSSVVPLVLAAISGAIVGAILTAAIVRAAPRSAQVVIPAAVPDVSRTILGLTGAPLPGLPGPAIVSTDSQVGKQGGAPLDTASPDGQAVPERPGAVPPSAPGPLTGTASWYAASGLIAAAGPALRHGDWRGSRVTVHGNGRSVTVTLSDWCQCYGSRLIDLSDDAFRRLAPLSRGLLKVTIDGSSAATLPPTDE